MKKCDLFPILDGQEKRLKQIQGLSNFMAISGKLLDHSKNDLCACLSIVSDLSKEMAANHETISKSVTALHMDDGA